MTNITITKEQFTNFIFTNGIDEDGAEVVFELACGCMAFKEDTGNGLVLCAAHDDEDVDNDGKSFTELVADIYTATEEPAQSEVAEEVSEEELVEAILEEAAEVGMELEPQTTNEKDEVTMTTVELKSTRKSIEFEIAVRTGAGPTTEVITGYKVEANVDVALAVHKRDKGWAVTELTTGYAIQNSSTMKAAVAGAEEMLNRIGMAKFEDMIVSQRIVVPVDNTPVVEEELTLDDTIAADEVSADELTLDDMIADDAPMIDENIAEEMMDESAGDDTPTVDEATEVQPVDAVVLAQELLDLIAKGTNFSTLMAKVKENATAIVNGGVVKSEPKTTNKSTEPTEKPVETQKPEQQKPGASEASAITTFSSARILERTATSVTFEGDSKKYIFLKNEAGKTIIRAIGSNSNQYMSAKYLQSLIYDINTQQSRALFRAIKTVGASTAPSTHKEDGAASEASAKEKNNTAKNNSAQVITMQGVEIPKAWFTQYVQDTAMTKKHGSSKMTATTIIAEFQSRKA